MATDENELTSPEIISLKGESSLVDNDIEVDVFSGPASDGTYPGIVAVDGRSGLIGNDISIRVSYGTPLPPKLGPVEPAQIDTTEAERANIRQELKDLARQIEDLFRHDYPLSPSEASDRSGLGENWPAVLDWRRKLENDLRIKYVNEIHPKVIDAYKRARARGFFKPELEECYSSRVLMVVATLPGLLRIAAARS